MVGGSLSVGMASWQPAVLASGQPVCLSPPESWYQAAAGTAKTAIDHSEDARARGWMRVREMGRNLENHRMV